MEMIKEIIEGIIKGAGVFITGHKANKKKKLHNLSEDLKRIADLLDTAKAKIKEKEIPKEEAICLDIVITYAEELATPFTKKYPKLAEVFDSLLPDIASQMQLADYVIDGKPRGDALLSDDLKNIRLSFTPEDQINKAYKELGNASSAIKEHSRKFEQLSE
jgi:hypothetical protein